MKGSPLTIVVIAAVVIIGGSIVTYLLIENSPPKSGFDVNRPQDVRGGEPRVPRPNVFEDDEPLALPPSPIPDDGTESARSGNATTTRAARFGTSDGTKPPQGSGGEVVRPLPPLPVPD